MGLFSKTKWFVVEIDFAEGYVELCCGGPCYKRIPFSMKYVSVKAVEQALRPAPPPFWPKSFNEEGR